MKTCRYRIYLLSLVSIVALFRLGFTPAPSVTLCVPPPSKGRLLQRMSSCLCSYIASSFAFALLARSRALCLLLRSLPPPHTFRLLPLPRYACHLPPGGRLLQRMSSRLCSYRRQFCFRTSRPLLRPLLALALLAAPTLSACSLCHATRAAPLPEGGFDKVATVVMGGKATDNMFFTRCRTKKQGACDAPYQRAVPCGFWIGRRLYYAVIYQETHARITRQNPL